MLAGGEGVRLRPLVRELCGDERPKQIAKIVGSKSLLSNTLGRVALKIRPERTAIVTCRAHGKYMEQEFTATLRQRVLVQPEDSGTAAGIFSRLIGSIRRILKQLWPCFAQIASSSKKALS